MRRVLERMTAPILNRLSRMVWHWALQGGSTNRLHQNIRQAGKQQPELIGPPVMTTGSVGKQLELLFLDSVFHLSSGAIHCVV
jgi:hypothetical protein